MFKRVALVGLSVLLAAAAHGSVIAGFVTLSTVLAEVDAAHLLSGLESGSQATTVYDRNNAAAFSFYTELRMDVALDQMSPHIVNALLAAEDHRFFAHHGLDPARMVGSALANLRAGRIVQGGSTITQQLVRATLLNRERTYRRKLRESILAAETEARFSKNKILEAYLNRVYFGDGYHGVEAAARGYFGKSASHLDPAESALLAGLIKAPSTLTPRRAVEPARFRRNLVLRAMFKQGWLAPGQFRDAVVVPVRTLAKRNDDDHLHRAGGGTELCGLYFKEELRRELIHLFGEERVYRDGLRVYSTIDQVMQLAAEQSIGQRLAALSKLTRGRAKTGAVELQGSLVAIDAMSGDVLALVGGRDFHASRFNRATQARRQPGSAFKPLVFAAALERGYAPSTVLETLDVPIVNGTESWIPEGEHEASTYTLRRALKVSSNRAAAQLLQRVGVSSALEMSRRLGIQSDLPAVPSLALGTGEVTLLELTSAYAAFANRGMIAAPRLIRRVEDRHGELLWQQPTAMRRALSEATAFLMSTMLADVINSGTAATARQRGFKLPAAGKTGTSDGYADAWFVGYTPRLVTGVWFGYDRPSSIMNRGFASVVAVPAWADFMKQATVGDKPDWFAMPLDVERVELCKLSGERAVEGCRQAATVEQVVWEMGDEGFEVPRVIPAGGVVEDYFALGTAAWGTCPLHGSYADVADEAGSSVLGPIATVSPSIAVGTSGNIVPVVATRPPR